MGGGGGEGLWGRGVGEGELRRLHYTWCWTLESSLFSGDVSTCHLLPGCVVFVWSAIERHDCDNASCSVRRPEATVIRSLLLQLLSFSKFL